MKILNPPVEPPFDMPPEDFFSHKYYKATPMYEQTGEHIHIQHNTRVINFDTVVSNRQQNDHVKVTEETDESTEILWEYAVYIEYSLIDMRMILHPKEVGLSDLSKSLGQSPADPNFEAYSLPPTYVHPIGASCHVEDCMDMMAEATISAYEFNKPVDK